MLVLQRTPERGGFWQLVTGRVEPGESVEAAARRELLEETGLDLPVAPLGYAHAFAWGTPPIAPGTEGDDAVPLSAPRLARETAFVARLERAADGEALRRARRARVADQGRGAQSRALRGPQGGDPAGRG